MKKGDIYLRDDILDKYHYVSLKLFEGKVLAKLQDM